MLNVAGSRGSGPKRLTTLQKRSAMAGFFFALGHSTVVLLMSRGLQRYGDVDIWVAENGGLKSHMSGYYKWNDVGLVSAILMLEDLSFFLGLYGDHVWADRSRCLPAIWM